LRHQLKTHIVQQCLEGRIRLVMQVALHRSFVAGIVPGNLFQSVVTGGE
jgi:hypothetical protein